MKTKLGWLAIAAVAMLWFPLKAQSQEAPHDAMPGAILPMPPVVPPEDGLVRWPLPPGDPAYAAIDGRHLHQYVVEQAAISRRYRDQGHPQFWGRIIGTSADAESAQWLAAKFKQIGLSDVRLQPFDLAPQWMPRSWRIMATSSGKTLHLGTAQPAYETPGTKPEGLDLEAVYVGTGSEADFIGRDVRGKAAFIYSMPLPGGTRPMANAEGATKRAQEKGAAAIFLIVAQPGNMRTQLYPTGTNVPTFALGMQDGYAVRDLIGESPAGHAPHVKIQLTVDRVPHLKTSTVWGTLPGATDENIYVIAHRDGWFDAAGDNASGVATMLGLAEYYAKIPKSQRRRTIVFLGTTGHHNSANLSVTDLIARKGELFTKTALLINSEHSSTLQTYLYTEGIRRANTYTAQFWYAGGPSRPKLQDLAIQAFREFGVSTYAEPDRAALPGDMSGLYRIVPGLTTSDFNTYFHTDEETPEVVPWTGLEATTRAYAKIIDGVNRLDLKDLQRPPEPPEPPRPPAAPGGLAGVVPPAPPVYRLQDAFLEWPLAPGDRAYRAIDGHRLHQYVVEQSAISRRYRDQDHAQFWGRIIGTSADAEDAQWLASQFKKIGLSGVHLQPLDLTPQWMPQSWEITATGGGKTLRLDKSAQPAYLSTGTGPDGLDLEAVWAGTGSEADFAGRDVRGKAVFMFSMPLPGSMEQTLTLEGGIKRAESKGAAAIFDVIALPGNMRNELYPTGANVPAFALGMEDGYAMREMIGKAPAGQAPRVKMRLNVKRVPDEKTALVWGTLPGATDEKIYVMAHRDGWFDAATDNASGVATMLGLAEYYSKIPKAQRRRTMVFLGLDGHHNDTRAGRNWLIAHKDEVFAKTALVINAEHTSTLQTYLYWEDIRKANTYTAQMWYAGGPTHPKLQNLAVKAFREFGVTTYAAPEKAPPLGDLGPFYKFAPGVDAGDFNMYFHTNAETPDTVPWTGLEASTRAYAKIIDGVNQLDLKDLQ